MKQDAMLEVQIENYSQGRILLQRGERAKRKAAGPQRPQVQTPDSATPSVSVSPPERTA
jgi:hypothetical protein